LKIPLAKYSIRVQFQTVKINLSQSLINITPN
jgi:hypothetical protein